MNSAPATVMSHQPIADLARLFSDQGIHHLPVLDKQSRVVGMLSQSDYVGALLAALK
jgi:CBS domain-containing membrane protein